MANFKVVVVGGGPVGLILAHVLSKAGIDYVVLEGRPEVVKDVGASLVLGTDSMRVLSQLGLLDKARAASCEILTWQSYSSTGRQFNGDHVGERTRASFGSYSRAFHRAELLQLLYDSLSPDDRARIHVGKRLSHVEHTRDGDGDGVLVTCEDGSVYQGAVVVGADGVHSRTRRFVREHMLRADPQAAVDGEEPFAVAYKTMWCSFPRRWEFPPGDHCITHGDTSSLQFINAYNRSWVFCYEKLATPPTSRVRYTDADMQAYAAKHGDTPIGDTHLRLKDVFAQRTSGGMANLEEGVLQHWSAGRIVLCGDACHKFTPNAGLGLNNGIQDAVVLVNELHRVCDEAAGGVPSQEELTDAFRRYHEMRKAVVESDLSFSSHTTRLQAWPNWIYWLVNRYVLPSIPLLNKIMWDTLAAPRSSKSYCLDFVEGEEPFQGHTPWARPMKPITYKAA